MKTTPKEKNTAWEKASPWYNKLIEEHQHYYLEKMIIPEVMELLDLPFYAKVLDVGCGEGVMSRALPDYVEYFGLDNAYSLIKEAKHKNRYPKHRFLVWDATKAWPKNIPTDCTNAIMILSLQNMSDQAAVIKEISRHLAPQAQLIIVLNHPCFRIPRQSGWGSDDQNKRQYRWINRYASPLKIPLEVHPSQNSLSPITWTFHQPVSFYINAFARSNLSIELMEEWSSDKKSIGKKSRQENLARAEIPLFMTFVLRKK